MVIAKVEVLIIVEQKEHVEEAYLEVANAIDNIEGVEKEKDGYTILDPESEEYKRIKTNMGLS